MAARKKSRTLLSIRGYARHRKAEGLTGQSHSAVRRAIADGRLESSVLADDAGHVQIDADLADREWADNTTATKSRGPGPSAELPASVEQPALFPGVEPSPEAIARNLEAGANGKSPALRNYLEHQAEFRGRLLELDFQRKAGTLCTVSEVESAAFSMGRTVRDKLMAIPDRVAPIVAAAKDTAKCHTVLTAELVAALEVLAQEPDE